MGYSFRNPFIFGTFLDDNLLGSGKKDFVFAGPGNDYIDPGAGDDVVFAGRGDDEIDGSPDDDSIEGGRGFDVVTYDLGINDYEITAKGWKWNQRFVVASLDPTAPDAGTDHLSRVEALFFAADNYTLFLDGQNNAVLAADDTITTNEDGTPLAIDAAQLLDNDQEFDGDTVEIAAVSTTSTNGARVSLVGGRITYDPGTLYQSLSVGDAPVVDTFTYTVDDGKGGIDTATVTITITPVNDLPVLTAPSAVTIDENTSLVTDAISATDVDANDTLVFLITGGADAAAFSIDSVTGDLSFATAPDFENPTDAGGDNVYNVQIGVFDGTETDNQGIAVTVSDVVEIPPRINEIHYDNEGSDVGEFVEIRVSAGDDPAALSVELYNGSNGTVYNTLSLPATPTSSTGGFDYYLISLPTNGLQNGSPDGIALIANGTVVEFLSYEGTLTAADGTAAGQTSIDIGVAEAGSTPIGLSLARDEAGDGWRAPAPETPGFFNAAPIAQLVISEVMQNPSAVSDSNGEYFEIYNAGTEAVDINGYTISDNGLDSHVIDNGGPLLIQPGEFLVLSVNADPSLNGGVPVDYEYGAGWFLANSDDEIIITDTLGREVDRIEYDGGPNWPDPTGASMELTDLSADNNVGANWTTSTESFGDGDLGTPGSEFMAPQPDVAQLVISEIMQNPGAVSDSNGEYFEIFNAGTEAVDINGYTIRDDGSDSHVIDNGGPLLIQPGAYLVLGNNADQSTNGCVPVEYAYDTSLFLSNSDDEVIIEDIQGNEIDRVAYDGGPNFPDPNGASMQLVDLTADNNVGANWEEATQPFGDGDLGTPGKDNGGKSSPVVINELAVSTSGTDWEFVELFGAAGTSLSGQSLLQVDAFGTVLNIIDLSGQQIGSDGYFLAASAQAETTFSLDEAEVDLSIPNNSFTNTGSTFLLADGVSVIIGNDLDTDDDGTIDIAGFVNLIDSVALVDGDAGGFAYSTNIVIDPTFPPAGTKRIENGTGPFQLTDFFESGDYTPGASNDLPPATERFIWEVQGSGETSAFVGQQAIVQGVVTYSISNGFFVQEEDADADGDAATSDGIFVFTSGAPTVTVGDAVRVTGKVSEFGSSSLETQLTGATVEIIGGGNPLPTPASLGLSEVTTLADLEALEGMYFTLSSGNGNALTVIENFNFDRFGEIQVSAGVQTQPTQTIDPDDLAAIAAAREDNENNRLTIDDGLGTQNPTEFAYVPNTSPGDNGNGILDAADDFAQGGTLRLGTEVAEVTGVLRNVFDDYKMLVEGRLELTDANPRPESPAGEYTGNLQIGAFNVLNYFTTLSGTTLGGVDVRGADNADELQRQTDKLVTALTGAEVEIFALQEIENGGFAVGSAIDELTGALNVATPGSPYAFVDPSEPGTSGLIGTDAITTGIIYDTRAVTLVNSDFLVFAESSAETTFNLTVDLAAAIGVSNPVGDFQRNRPVVVATFEDNDSGEVFTVASVHFKSKGPSGLSDIAQLAEDYLAANPTDTVAQAAFDALLEDPNFDQNDGQGFWNQVRADAAAEAYTFITTVYDVFGDGSQIGTQNYVITGDYNAYTREDPVQAIAGQADTTDLLAEFVGPDAYSFVFDGQRGALDQAVASNGFAADVQDVFEWHINADEPDLLNYDTSFNDPGFFAPDEYASSDHDPLIIDLLLDGNNPDTFLFT